MSHGLDGRRSYRLVSHYLVYPAVIVVTLLLVTFETPERRLRLWAVHLTSETSLLRDHTMLVIRDVTPEYRINQIRKDFVANVSHVLKTPLTMIQGAVGTLTDIPPEKHAKRIPFEEMIRTHTGRMTKIVEDLLNLARVEQEDRVSLTDRVSIAAGVESAPGRGSTFIIHIPGGTS